MKFWIGSDQQTFLSPRLLGRGNTVNAIVVNQRFHGISGKFRRLTEGIEHAKFPGAGPLELCVHFVLDHSHTAHTAIIIKMCAQKLLPTPFNHPEESFVEPCQRWDLGQQWLLVPKSVILPHTCTWEPGSGQAKLVGPNSWALLVMVMLCELNGLQTVSNVTRCAVLCNDDV